MAKRNQYNRRAFSTPVVFNRPTTATNVSFLGLLDLPVTSTLFTGSVVANDTILIDGADAHDGFAAGNVVFTQVTLTPGQQFQVGISNSDIGSNEAWMTFTQLSGPTGSYSNLESAAVGGGFTIRCASHTDTIAPGSRLEVSYFHIRSTGSNV